MQEELEMNHLVIVILSHYEPESRALFFSSTPVHAYDWKRNKEEEEEEAHKNKRQSSSF